ncbi:MAG: hypothetical protein EHM23_22570 [Acidobacteria bacterium]|nr:MAG: hypothetical protein EHM23_22570 [Acidobacteriota bacterium]
MKRHLRIFAIALLALPLIGAKFWESKNYKEWSEKECLDLLAKSPWCFTNSFGQLDRIGMSSANIPGSTQSGQAGETASGPTWGERESIITFDFRLMSAKPVRAALARLQMIKNPDVPGIEERIDQYVNSDPGNEIVFQVIFSVKPKGDSSAHDILEFLRRAALADFHGTTYLASDRSVPLTAYIPPSERNPNPAFVFSRVDPEGKPYFTGQEKSISLRSALKINTKGKLRQFDIFFQMKPKDMKFQERFEM